MPKNARDAMYRSGSKGGGRYGTLQRDPDGHQKPGFLPGESAPMVPAKSYTDWSKPKNTGNGTKISIG